MSNTEAFFQLAGQVAAEYFMPALLIVALSFWTGTIYALLLAVRKPRRRGLHDQRGD